MQNKFAPNHWLLIYNPKSGKGRFGKNNDYILTTLKKEGILFEYRVTKYARHAIKIAREYANNGCLNFAIIGGDGTINEVINGIFSSECQQKTKIKVALFPRGTGNDWSRYWAMQRDDKHSMKIFLQGNTNIIDIGKICYQKEEKENRYYFINSTGFGLDPTVAAATNRLKKYVGSHSLLYFIAFLAVVFRFVPKQTTVKVNNRQINRPLLTMNIANGPFSGGGIKQNPKAIPDDGIFDLIVVGKVNFWDIIRAIPLLFNGKLTTHDKIDSFQSEKVSITTENKNVLFEADGLLLYFDQKCEVEILKNAVQFVVE